MLVPVQYQIDSEITGSTKKLIGIIQDVKGLQFLTRPGIGQRQRMVVKQRHPHAIAPASITAHPRPVFLVHLSESLLGVMHPAAGKHPERSTI